MTFAHEDARTFLQCDTVLVMVEDAWNSRPYIIVQRSDLDGEVAGNLSGHQSVWTQTKVPKLEAVVASQNVEVITCLGS